MKNEFTQRFFNDLLKTIKTMGFSIPSNVLKMDYYTAKNTVVKMVEISKKQNNNNAVLIGRMFLAQH